jgi:hypothetical protein
MGRLPSAPRLKSIVMAGGLRPGDGRLPAPCLARGYDRRLEAEKRKAAGPVGVPYEVTR